MNTTQTQAIIGMLAVLGLLVFMVTPAVIGIVHERRMERQIRKAEQSRRDPQPARQVRRRSQRFVTTTVTHHS
ncbi:hypothetical protein ACIO93_25040 [Streptomyces sp. NPDC087903]|uniref:hypothetical protein n=1 Tax=Streptomyces sp. NPDC087903 TaxID=3365819 RepID=UPI0038230F76